MSDRTSHIEVIWGHRLLDEGFTAIPNIIIRNYRKLDISHGEWGLICTLLTYKHDERDPYPSQETLAQHLDVSVRQIKKWVESLVDKQLLLVGQRRNSKNKQFGSAVYNFKPLIQAALKLVGEAPLPDTKSDWDIEYRNPSVLQVHLDPSEPEVPTEAVPEVHLAPVPEVPTKKTIKKRQIEHNNKEHVAVVQAEIECHLGTPIPSLVPLLHEWIQTYGRQELIHKARYIGATRGKWNNIVGTYRQAVIEKWDVAFEGGYLDKPARDERYSGFYELFPEA